MPLTSISALPSAPSRFATPSDFEDQVDTYLAGQATLVSEVNTLVGEWNSQLTSSYYTSVYTLGSTQQSTSVTLADITGLSHTLTANKTYKVTAYVTFQSAATTTGLNLGFVGPSGSNPMVTITVPLASTDASSSLRKSFPVAGSTTSGNVLGTGVTAINSNHTAVVEGIVLAGSTGGVFKLQFATEVAASAITLQIGSTMVIEEI